MCRWGVENGTAGATDCCSASTQPPRDQLALRHVDVRWRGRPSSGRRPRARLLRGCCTSLGCLPRSRPLALATFMPSRVRSRIRSDSNSATIASTLNSSHRRRRCRECLAESRALAIGAGQAVVDVDRVDLDAESGQGLMLRSEVLLIGGASRVPHKQRAHGAPGRGGPGRAAQNAVGSGIRQRPTPPTSASRAATATPAPSRMRIARRDYRGVAPSSSNGPGWST